MTKVKVYNLEGKEVDSIELNPSIFAVAPNKILIAQAVRVQEANAREAVAHTKTRAEVRGGGKKPWKQKGTGRARAGSSRSPIWIGGGITFGPRSDRNFSLSINKKQKRKALFMTLTDKVQDNKLIVVDSFALKGSKTKDLAQVLKKLNITSSALLATAGKNDELVHASGNLKKVEAIRANSLNVVDVLKHGYLVIEKDSLPVIEETYKA